MRASKRPSADDIRQRYLGEIAPLLDAARQIDSLNEIQRKRVRKRILRTAFRTRFLSYRVRFLPVLVALGMLVIGGAAFAMVERLGLFPKVGTKPSSSPAAQSPSEMRKRRGSVGRPAGRLPGLPEVPDPLVQPMGQSTLPGWTVVSELRDLPRASTVVRAAPLQTSANPVHRPSRRIAYLDHAPVMPAPAPVMSAPALPAVPAVPTTAPVSPALAAPVSSAKPVATLPSARPTLGDQALFGQAMRKLRMENNPAAALIALQEHGKFYARSSLGGERNALEVEALLALHRNGDALALLNTMDLDALPRSGERFVVRGELRAAARQWLEASADFDHALTRVSGSPAWHERALWGRGVARLRCGEREAGMADIERYLDKYPDGRFASEAARFFPNR